MTAVERSIAIYDSENERLIEEIRLDDVRLDDLLRLFDHPADDSLYLCYPIGDEQRQFFEAKTGRSLNEPGRSYFLECHAVSAAAAYDLSREREHHTESVRDVQDR
jgi:hypothetical protein